jgi:hypothetical protein
MVHRLLLQIEVGITNTPFVADTSERHHKVLGKHLNRQIAFKLSLLDSFLQYAAAILQKYAKAAGDLS